ncbi:hypothetical protein IAQ61_010805 [Plenodomus lingam]|uniref:Predicted protein n=1 Tax=Leptosphaeria maculans (strain JN3 / isolate v23.1.3 / race Av1-4-5-6-7-8) TaxID=985895 RepID=E4ZJ28_LEPMJ|nr:predicted protein [Plenodomus lingam JN3]KAH9861069.1 hypothetical protein IAQ61_010805 [Plenodomus lingam]CBX91459.1 predicted protein [Plenodomus lingam JN3]
MPNIVKATLAALAVAPLVLGHTWIEQMRNVNDKGEYVGQYGYSRGMVSKTDPEFTGTSMNWELPAGQGKLFIDETTPLCHTAQRKQVQSSEKYPRLQATPGGYIAMRYQENGHVTKPGNQKGKPEKGGTVFVYGTAEPDENETLLNVLQWTQDGQGGNKKGALITMNDFDDGRCYETDPTNAIWQERSKAIPNFAMGQVVEGAPGNYPLACETNVQLPQTAALDKPYTFYWVWQWNTAPGIDPGLPKGKDEYYTTCIDVDVTSPDVALAAEASQKYAVGQQDAMSKAVSDYNKRTALMTDVVKGEVGPIFSGSPSGSPSGTPAPTGAPSPVSPSVPANTPAPTGGASSPPPLAPSPPVVPSISSGAPFLNSTQPAPTKIPTLSQRPGPAPTSLPPSGSFVTITDIVMVTVTETSGPAVTPRAIDSSATYSARHPHGAKFRGRFAS